MKKIIMILMIVPFTAYGAASKYKDAALKIADHIIEKGDIISKQVELEIKLLESEKYLNDISSTIKKGNSGKLKDLPVYRAHKKLKVNIKKTVLSGKKMKVKGIWNLSCVLPYDPTTAISFVVLDKMNRSEIQSLVDAFDYMQPLYEGVISAAEDNLLPLLEDHRHSTSVVVSSGISRPDGDCNKIKGKYKAYTYYPFLYSDEDGSNLSYSLLHNMLGIGSVEDKLEKENISLEHVEYLEKIISFLGNHYVYGTAHRDIGKIRSALTSYKEEMLANYDPSENTESEDQLDSGTNTELDADISIDDLDL